uniref:Uncharacterized protein n=1 Tax=Cannabis sativa TaxID=3483 RepID=A0A803PTV6_CANSA
MDRGREHPSHPKWARAVNKRIRGTRIEVVAPMITETDSLSPRSDLVSKRHHRGGVQRSGMLSPWHARDTSRGTIPKLRPGGHRELLIPTQPVLFAIIRADAEMPPIG